MGTVLVIIIVILLFWPWIAKWLKGFAMRRAEDMFRRAAGMPTRKEEEKARKRARKSRGDGYERRDQSRRARRNAPDPHPASMMREVAEDVEYTEIVDYSSESYSYGEQTARGRKGTRAERTVTEEQVSDAEYTEYRKKQQ